MRHFFTVRSISLLLIAVPVSLLAACAGTSAGSTESDTSGASAEQALATAQASYREFKTAADACFATFKTCSEAAGADVAACKTALKSCLPAAPPEPASGCHAAVSGAGETAAVDATVAPTASAQSALKEAPNGSGTEAKGAAAGEARVEMKGRGTGGAAGEMEMRREGTGGCAPVGGEKARSMFGQEGRGERCGNAPLPSDEDVAKPISELAACLDAGTSQADCIAAHHAAEKTAFQAVFTAACDGIKTSCDAGDIPTAVCEKVAARCSKGVDPQS